MRWVLKEMDTARQNGIDPVQPQSPVDNGVKSVTAHADKSAATTGAPGKSSGTISEKSAESLRQQLTTLKNDLQAERLRNKQIHREKVD